MTEIVLGLTRLASPDEANDAAPLRSDMVETLSSLLDGRFPFEFTSGMARLRRDVTTSIVGRLVASWAQHVATTSQICLCVSSNPGSAGN